MVFNLFREKLNSRDHKDIVNYLIIEEAEQQWNYHKENNFKKEAFRGIPFAKQTILLFVEGVLKMKINDELLLSIVDLGFRRGKEIVDEYKDLEKKINKLKNDDLVTEFVIHSKFTELYLQNNQEIQTYNQLIIQSGFKAIDFNYRSEVYQVMCQNIRNLDLGLKAMKKFYKNDKDKIEQAMNKVEDWINSLGKEGRKKLINKFQDKVYEIVNLRNKNNLI
jgi:hypothetical protein